MEGKDALGDCLTDGHNLRSWTTSSDANAKVEVLEPVSTEQEDGFTDLQSHGGWFDNVERFSVHADKSLAVRAMADCSGVFLSSKGLDTSFLFRHLFLR